MKEETKDTAVDLIAELENPTLPPVSKMEISQENFMNSAIGFLLDRMKTIEKEGEFKAIVTQKLTEMIGDDDEGLTAGQLIHLYDVISDKNMMSAESIISLLKGGKEGSSPLLLAAVNNKKVEDYSSNMTSDQLKSAEVVYRVVEALKNDPQAMELNKNKKDLKKT